MNREALKKHVSDWTKRLGSQDAVAEKCGYSGTALSLWMADKYGAGTNNLDRAIAKALNYRERKMTIVPTIHNYRKIEFVFRSCKEQSLWMPISEKAGSGKTETLEDLFNRDTSGSVFYLQAEEWNARQFILKLAEITCGVPKRGYLTISAIMDMIAGYFNNLGFDMPILLIDEADKLKPKAFRQLIPLYNKTEDRLGCIVSGTENLQKEIQRGVRNNIKGFDEMDSRLGRNYIGLPGAPEDDVLAICEANGLDRETSMKIWEEIDKVKKPAKVKNIKGEISEKMIFFCDDLRRLARLIKREQLANIALC